MQGLLLIMVNWYCKKGWPMQLQAVIVITKLPMAGEGPQQIPRCVRPLPYDAVANRAWSANG